MAYMHLPYAPGLVRRWHGYVEVVLDADAVHLVDVVDPDRHPHTVAVAAAALIVQAEEHLAGTAADRAEGRRIAVVPEPAPAESFEPGEAGVQVGDVHDGIDGVRVHGD